MSGEKKWVFGQSLIFLKKLSLPFRVQVCYTDLATQLNLLIRFTMGELLGNKCFSLNSLYP
jgi:hypothetical protein